MNQLKIVDSVIRNKKVEVTLKFNTPIYLDEKNQIDQLFKYYQELEDFINTNYEKLWLIE